MRRLSQLVAPGLGQKDCSLSNRRGKDFEQGCLSREPRLGPGRRYARDNPRLGIALALPFRARGLLCDGGDLVGGRALDAGGVVGGNHEVVG
jgi:hypothetical protein